MGGGGADGNKGRGRGSWCPSAIKKLAEYTKTAAAYSDVGGRGEGGWEGGGREKITTPKTW